MYPSLLRETYDPPVTLYVKGAWAQCLEQPCIAIVGSRRCSTYGQNAALMLSRELAHEGHFPAIDVLQSTSRLAGDLATREELALMGSVVEQLATYQRNRQMVDMGAYRAGSNPELDRAVRLMPQIDALLRQDVAEVLPRTQTMRMIQAIAQAER